MLTLALIGLLATSAFAPQEVAANPQAQPTSTQAEAPAPSQEQTLTIPAGTRIPLSLSSPIMSKSARPGSPVRAVTGFPVTVGSQLAIPVGTYVEGVIDQVTKGGRSGPNLKIHFTRILYANGYSVAMDGKNVQARVLRPGSSPSETTAFSGQGVSGNSLAAGSSSQLPTMQPPASHTGAIVGLGIGSAAATIAIGLLMHRHAGNSSGPLFDTGWQFEMVLESPLSVDAESVAAAAALRAQ